MVLAWSALSIIMVAVGTKGSVQPARRTHAPRVVPGVTLAGAVSVATSPVTAASPATKYVVRSGDTLSGIAARFAVRGGWQALYAANRPPIGPDPDVIRAGTTLVVRGGHAPPATRLHPATP